MLGNSGVLPTYDNPILEGLTLEGGRVQQKSNRQSVRFYMDRHLEMCAVLSEDGRKIVKYEPKPVQKLKVRIETPGDKNIFDDYANDYHKSEFFRHYKAFSEGKGAPEGHSIDDCEQIQPGIALDLKMYGVHTMEQLADAPDIILDRLPSGMGKQYQHFAQQWCQINSPQGIHAVTKKLSAELANARAEVEQLRQAQSQQTREIVQLKKTMTDGDGNPVFSHPIEDGVALPGAVEVEPPESATVQMTAEQVANISKNKKKP